MKVNLNIENRLTIAHLMQNKRRSLITIMGIALAVAMFTAVVSAGASFLDLLESFAISTEGNYHFRINNDRDYTIAELESNEDVEDYCHEYILDEPVRSYYIKNGVAMHTSVGMWRLGDKKYFEWMIQRDYDGRLPQKPKEIMLNRGIIDENKLGWKIGDKVEIATVARKNVVNDEYWTYAPTGPYEYGETIEEQYSDTYTIVGIINSNELNSMIYRYPSSSETKNAYLCGRMKKLSPATVQRILALFKNVKINPKKYGLKANMNSTLLLAHMSINDETQKAVGVIGVFAAILAIIMVCAVVLIYNAFSMSYAEKIRYLGMLSSVGATRTQKLRSTYFEAVVLGGIGIPIGFAMGMVLTKTATLTLGKVALTAGVIDGAENMQFRTVIPWWSCVIILALSVLTLLISIYMPAMRASQITPINAIRLSEEYKAIKSSHSPWIIRRLLGYEGILAYKNQRRNGRKGRIITISIALSIVLVPVCNYAGDIVMQNTNINEELPYQLYVAHEATDHSEFEQYLSEREDVDRFYCIEESYLWQDYQSDGTQDADLSAINTDTLTPKYKGLIDSNVYYNFFGIKDEDFDAYCRDNGIDPKPFYQTEKSQLKCVVMNNINHKRNGAKVFTDKLLGKEMYEYYVRDSEFSDGLPDKVMEMFDMSCPHFVFTAFGEYDDSNYMCHLSGVNTVSCFYPYSKWVDYQAWLRTYDEDYDASIPCNTQVIYGIETKQHKKVAKDLQYYFEGSDTSGNEVIDIASVTARVNAVQIIAKTLVYAFIILIIMIIVFNIINTISTSTALREKEFAMLKSVGLTPKGFRRMIVYEGIFNVLRALLLGVPVSIGINYAINRILGDGKIPFTINVPLYLLVCGAALAIVLASMLMGMKAAENNSIIESIKKDIT